MQELSKQINMSLGSEGSVKECQTAARVLVDLHTRFSASALPHPAYGVDKVAINGGSDGKSQVSLIAVHACGLLTDAALDLAIRLTAPIAVMPCCYSGTAKSAPLGPRRALGVSLAADVDRSYRLDSSGFLVDWSAIPFEITAMNRIIIAIPR